MKTKAPRGVFGGTAGLWLVRKKHCAVTLLDRGESSSDANISLQSPHPTEKSLIAGWDEVRCRPIYKKNCEVDDHSTASTQQENEHDDRGNDTPLFASIKKPRHRVSTETPENYPRAPPSSTIVKARGHRPRAVYGGRRTRTILPVVGVVTESRDTMSGTDDDDDDSVDIRNEDHPSKRKRICIITTRSNTDSIPFAQAPETESKISNRRAGDDSKFDFDQTDGPNATIGRIPDYVTRRRRQPGYRTSLDVARAFFAHIDADPTLLTLERDGPTPPPRRRRPVHTTRGRLPPEVAQAAYQNYCAACRDATVSPLPLSAFLQQRSEFFRTGEVFNGMFDD